MKTHQERDNAPKVIQQKGNKQEPSFKDERSETVMQGKLYDMVNNSGRVTQLQSLQRMADNRVQNNAFSPIQRKENNTGLPDNLKSGIENLSGYSMDDVNVHYNSPKPAQLQAHAYAQGTDIHLGAGQEKHLPHEAWHVVQQKQGRVKPTIQMKGKVNVNDDKGLEQEADTMGTKALQFRTINQLEDSKQKINSRNNEPTFKFADNRPEAIAQRKLQDRLSNSSPVAQLLALQEIANNNPQRKQTVQLQAITENKTTVIQRNHTDTGLKKDKATEEYAGKMKTRFSGEKNPMGSTKQWATLSNEDKGKKLIKYANQQLVKTHVPPLKGAELVAAAQPTFDLTTWKINLVGDLSRTDEAYLDWLVDTIYHESRHCEQWFRIARKRAGEGETATQITANMNIPSDVAAAAVKRPLKEQSKLSKFFHSKKYNERQANKLQEANDWDRSIYGADSGRRNAILTGDMTPGTQNYADYENLPEERDAYIVGPKAKNKYKNL